MKQWVYLIISLLFGSQTMGCTMKKMPEGKLISYEYIKQGTAPQPDLSITLQLRDDGKAVLNYMQYWTALDVTVEVSASVLDSVRTLIDEHEMYQYKDNYQPIKDLEIMDGTSWSYVATFDNGEKLCSRGNNCDPKGNGLATVNDYLYSLVKDKKKEK